jgi:hypothetical protein
MSAIPGHGFEQQIRAWDRANSEAILSLAQLLSPLWFASLMLFGLFSSCRRGAGDRPDGCCDGGTMRRRSCTR